MNTLYMEATSALVAMGELITMQNADDPLNVTAASGIHEDSAFAADVLLLFRLVLAEDKVGSRARKALDRIAAKLTLFQGGGSDVARLVEAFGPLLPLESAFATFREMDAPRRAALARHVMTIAGEDAELARHRERIRGRVAEIVAVDPADFA